MSRSSSVLLFALVWISAAWFGSWHGNPNNAVRLFAAISIVEEGDATIDQFQHLTIDKARFGQHFYLDKAPGMTLLAAPVVAAVDRVTGDRVAGKSLSIGSGPFDRYLIARQWAAAAAINATLLALAAVALMDTGRRATGSIGAGAFAALSFALGTPLWGWATTLFGHAAVASLLIIAVRFVTKGTDRDRSRYDAAIAGFALGLALLIEHTALLFAIPVGLFALWRMRMLGGAGAVRATGKAVVAGAAGLMPLLAYNVAAFGDPFHLGYQSVVGWEGMEQGLFGLTYPRLSLVSEILFGTHRGLLWVAPILLVAPIGILRAWRFGPRELAILASVGAVTAVLYNAAYVYWDGGNSTGPRHAMPAVTFLALVLPMLWARAGRLDRWLLSGLLAVSIGINLTIASAEIMAAWNVPHGLIDGVWRGRFLPGDIRTVPSQWFGVSPWMGLGIWAGVAAVLFLAFMLAIARQPHSANIYRTDGATRRS
ncbi:hypothetical protein [Sphingomonas sp. IW22]|uniref:hypothetical protein n=1 Tax=Sphingomonas sp. IW22 TaxID=3242489 RepID=UPI003521732B